jgi:hypothetical protein
MKIYKTQEEIKKDIKNGELFVNEDVTFECSFEIDASLRVNGDIYAGVYNINAYNINANDINTNNINAYNINANDIIAHNINANNIKYYALCFAYGGIKCSSIEAIRLKSQEPICLDGKLEIEEKIEELTIEEVCKLLGKTIKIKK